MQLPRDQPACRYRLLSNVFPKDWRASRVIRTPAHAPANRMPCAGRLSMVRPQSDPGQRSRRYPMRKLMLLTCGFILGAALSPLHAQTLRVAMTTSDIPTTGGIPDNGSEGGRFAGYPIFDALVNWDFTKTDEIADLTPGLATEWHVDPNDHKRWIFTLREGVKYHDGTTFKADDVIWNFDRHLYEQSPHFDG